MSGHSTMCESDEEGKQVCSAVSSAAYMAVNTITDVIGDTLDIAVEDGYMKAIASGENVATQTVLKGLKLHLEGLSEQYGKRIKIITEVQ